MVSSLNFLRAIKEINKPALNLTIKQTIKSGKPKSAKESPRALANSF